MKRLIPLMDWLERLAPKSVIATVVFLSVFVIERLVGWTPMWIVVLVLLLIICSVLKNIETREKYHGLLESSEEDFDIRLRKHERYLIMLNDLIQLAVGCGFVIVIAINLKRLGF